MKDFEVAFDAFFFFSLRSSGIYVFFRRKVPIVVQKKIFILILVAVTIKKICLCITRTAETKALHSAYELVCKYKVSVENVNFMLNHNEQRQKSLTSN